MNPLGERTTKKFLKHLIPDNFKEIVFRGAKHWACCVDGSTMSNKQWNELQQDLKEAFGDNLIEISKATPSRFIVYLRRD